jgi:hypothetical protein
MLSSAVGPPKRWRKRMERIGAGLPRLLSVEDLDADPGDLARLTLDEQHELCRLMGAVQQVGLAGRADGDRERLCCLRVFWMEAMSRCTTGWIHAEYHEPSSRSAPTTIASNAEPSAHHHVPRGVASC